MTPSHLTLVDGQAKQLDFSFGAGANTQVPATVTLTPSVGVALSQTTFTLSSQPNEQTQTVYARLNTGVKINGAQVTIQVAWSYPSIQNCNQKTQTITLKVEKKAGCTGISAGDPHLKSLDGTKFDFQGNGVFTLVKSKSLEIQTATRPCGNGVTCNHAAAVAFGNSVVRISRDGTITKGTSTLDGLSVEQVTGRGMSYRIFVTSDPSTYVDVNVLGRWLDVSVVLSPYFLNVATGLLGNGNGNPKDDELNQAILESRFRISSTNNLFNCVNGCADLVKPLTEADKIKVDPVAILKQGYTPLNAAGIPLRAMLLNGRRLEEERTPLLRERRLQVNEFFVRMLCTQVIQSIKECAKYVENPDFFINELCIKDTLAMGDSNNIDHAKLAYLRQCRRNMDTTIALDPKASVQKQEQAKQDRENLSLANPNKCPQNCSGRGICMPNGCQCNVGFTGLSCGVKLF